MVRILCWLFLSCFLIGGLTGCQSTRKFLKSKPAEVSPFLHHRGQLRRNPSTAAFQYEWQSRDARLVNQARPLRQIYVAPVSLRYLRPPPASVARWRAERGVELDAEAATIARRLREEVIKAFRESPETRYRVVSQPNAESLTLELAITELSATKVTANAAKIGAKMLFGPVATVGSLAFRIKSTTAIEGRVALSASGQALYEFADQEQDKMTLYSLRDFAPYGHVVVALEEWAKQIEETSRSGSGAHVSDASFWTLSPW